MRKLLFSNFLVLMLGLCYQGLCDECIPLHSNCEMEQALSSLLAQFEKLKTDVDYMFDDLGRVKVNLETNTNQLETSIANLTLNLNNEIEETDNDLSVLSDGLNAVEHDIEEMIHESTLSSLPMGTIVSWVPRPSREAGSTENEDLPDKWQICDGSEILEGPWAGQFTPDLTNLFLRGGSVSEYLLYEDDTIQDHTHEDPGHSHPNVPHNHDYTDCAFDDPRFDDGGTGNRRGIGCDSKTTWSTTITIESAVTGIGGVLDDGTTFIGEETRPKNKRVVFIIKIG